MSILIKNAKVIDTKSQYHNEKVDIWINNGIITQIKATISKNADQLIDLENLHISPGWIDIGAMCWEPGHEYREDIASLQAASVNGGYTNVFILPNTTPVIDNKGQFLYVKNQSGTLPVNLLPICCISKKAKGQELSEILDLCDAGAILFSDGLEYHGNSSELCKALEYIKPTQAKMMYAPNPFNIFPDGQVHESRTSVLLGLQGLPELSEKMDLETLVQLAEYAESHCIVHNISSGEALKICKSDSISAVGTSYLNLCKDVSNCELFDTNYKVIPPLRSASDRKSLVKGVESDKISYISSNHLPLENDLKDKEFGMAQFGASGIETTFAGLRTDTNLEISKIIEKLTYGPALATGIELNAIDENTTANLTLFNPDLQWTYDDSTRRSKCFNNPYYQTLLKGKVYGVIGKHSVAINS